ncbi:aromatic prenyltransferase [Streptomyces sp. NPDC058989]|uniref:aromatic prenyltransferase n=1 Tax=Streptomyces sp. NPDC058989 TaxID=3346686 RepID=UPI0036739579
MSQTLPSPLGLDLAKLRADLHDCAQAVEVPFNAPAVDRLLSTLADLCTDAWLGMRTTTRPAGRRDLNLRVCYRRPVHPVPLLREAGLLTFDGHPMERLLDELVDAFPLWWGIDASVSGSVDKFWLVFDNGVPLADVLALPHLPPAVRASQDHFERAGMDRVGLIALDFGHRTVNVYSPVFPPGTLTYATVTSLISGLGFPLPAEEELQRNTDAFDVYQTFSWDEPGVLRLCFPVRYTAADFPTHCHPVLKQFVETAPFAVDQRSFVHYTTYGPRGGYFKVQSDYTGNHRDTFLPQ